MKSIEVQHITDEKKISFSEKLPACLNSSFWTGFFWLCGIFLLEIFISLINNEDFRFDKTDLAISLAGFVLGFFRHISNRLYQKIPGIYEKEMNVQIKADVHKYPHRYRN